MYHYTKPYSNLLKGLSPKQKKSYAEISPKFGWEYLIQFLPKNSILNNKIHFNCLLTPMKIQKIDDFVLGRVVNSGG